MDFVTENQANKAYNYSLNLVSVKDKSLRFDARSPLYRFKNLLLDPIPAHNTEGSIISSAEVEAWLLTQELPEEIENYISEAAITVTRSMEAIRTIVLPLAVNFSERLSDNMARFRQDADTPLYSVNQIKHVAPIQDGSSSLDYAVYKGQPLPQGFSSRGVFSTLDNPISVVAKLVTNRPDREKILNWVEGSGAAAIDLVWGKFFLNTVTDKDLENFFKEAPLVTRMDACFALYLLADVWQGQVDETSSGMDLATYQTALKAVKAYAAVMLNRAIRSIESSISRGVLVLDICKRTRTIHVLGRNYEEYVKGGGGMNALLGSVNDNDLDPKLDGMIKKIISHELAFKRTRTALQHGKDLRELAFFKKAFMALVMEDSTSVSELEEAYNGIDRLPDAVIEDIQAMVDDVTTTTMMDYDALAHDYVAKHRFYFTPANEVLGSINSIGKQDPDISIEDAVVVATVAMVGKFVGQQVETV